MRIPSEKIILFKTLESKRTTTTTVKFSVIVLSVVKIRRNGVGSPFYFRRHFGKKLPHPDKYYEYE